MRALSLTRPFQHLRVRPFRLSGVGASSVHVTRVSGGRALSPPLRSRPRVSLPRGGLGPTSVGWVCVTSSLSSPNALRLVAAAVALLSQGRGCAVRGEAQLSRQPLVTQAAHAAHRSGRMGLARARKTAEDHAAAEDHNEMLGLPRQAPSSHVRAARSRAAGVQGVPGINARAGADRGRVDRRRGHSSASLSPASTTPQAGRLTQRGRRRRRKRHTIGGASAVGA